MVGRYPKGRDFLADKDEALRAWHEQNGNPKRVKVWSRRKILAAVRGAGVLAGLALELLVDSVGSSAREQRGKRLAKAIERRDRLAAENQGYDEWTAIVDDGDDELSLRDVDEDTELPALRRRESSSSNSSSSSFGSFVFVHDHSVLSRKWSVGEQAKRPSKSSRAP